MSSGIGEFWLNFSKMTECGYSARIRQIMETKGLKIASFSRLLGVPRSTLVGWFNGKSVSIGVLKTLEERLEVNLDWFLTGDGGMFEKPQTGIEKSTENRKIPLLRQQVSCGGGASWETEENIEKYIDIFSVIPTFSTGRLYAFKAFGSSMIGAGIHSGDYLIFDATMNFVPIDDIYVFALDGEMYCKRLEFDMRAQKVKIYSVRVAELEKAELTETIDLTDESSSDRFRIFGKVRCWIRPNYTQGEF